MSKRVYHAYIRKTGTPFEELRWMIVEKTGWTLEYIDALDIKTLHEYLQVLDGREKGKNSYFNRVNHG